MTAAPDTRSRILSTARGLFHGRSDSDVGVKEICDRTGVLKGSFYYFFPSKRDGALAVIEDVAQAWAPSANAGSPVGPSLRGRPRLGV
jgi:TetR/AcrR family transcriptional repressor of nem operon